MGTYWAEIADQNQTARQIQFLKTQLKPGGCVLDLACGTGRHTILLNAAGFGMVGLDVSLNLLKIAKQRDPAIRLVRGDIRFLPFKAAAFCVVISMDTSFGYLSSEEADLQGLVEARRVLRRRGELIVDVFNQSNLMAKYLGKTSLPKLSEYPGFFLQQKRMVSGDGGRLYDFWEVRDKGGGAVRVFEHSVRLYGRARLERMLEAAGFIVNGVCGGYEGQEYSPESSRLIMLASAK
jgi:ubiquinone/menaquinone biosynthesis C-methylase UbiE